MYFTDAQTVRHYIPELCNIIIEKTKDSRYS